ncbi:MAG: transposase [Nocardioidaceae bacterium]
MINEHRSIRAAELPRWSPRPCGTRSRPCPFTRQASQGRRPSQALEVVLSAIGGGRNVDDVCKEHDISSATYHEWRDEALGAATGALEESAPSVPGGSGLSGRQRNLPDKGSMNRT